VLTVRHCYMQQYNWLKIECVDGSGGAGLVRRQECHQSSGL